jgi:hypothetical protein
LAHVTIYSKFRPQSCQALLAKKGSSHKVSPKVAMM